MKLSKYHIAVRENSPLVHCITNYVTVNDVANALLAAGASPIMADEPTDAIEITGICDALCLNIGTLNSRTIPAMLAAGSAARELGHPVLLDPVGAGASALRTKTAEDIMAAAKPLAVRCNASELKALAAGGGSTRGVDAAQADMASAGTLGELAAMAKGFAAGTGAVVAVTGEIDIVADAGRAFAVRGGHAMMARITGSGCMLSALATAYLAASPTEPLPAVLSAVAMMGIAGEYANTSTIAAAGGTASFRMALIDAIATFQGDKLDEAGVSARISEL
jgi:hydroxyethylthiazole kinase